MVMNLASERKRKPSISAGVYFFIFGFCFLALAVFLEINARNHFLVTLGACLGLLIFMASYLGYRRDGAFSPILIFSAMYFGYVLGAFYYAYSIDYFGKFLEFLAIDRKAVIVLMKYALAYAIVGYFLFCLGYFMFLGRDKDNFIIRRSGFLIFFSNYYWFFVIPLLLIGLIYWYWVAIVAAGGMLDLLVKFQAFRHLIVDKNITTLPYHFYYAGIFLWLLGAISKKGKVGSVFWFFSFLGTLMTLTQGRISLAITFLVSQIIFIAIVDPDKENKATKFIILIILFAFVVYFLRIASNYFFIGRDFIVSDINFFNTIIGSGNVTDVQQLVILFYSFDAGNSLLGGSYIDWLRNSVGGAFGISPSSVGLIVKELYVPESSGAPTPGAIGEAYANFNFGAPLVMFVVGLMFFIIRSFSIRSGSLFWALLYSVFLARFVFMYPKVDSTMFLNFLWGVLPFCLVISVLYFCFSIAQVPRNNIKFL